MPEHKDKMTTEDMIEELDGHVWCRTDDGSNSFKPYREFKHHAEVARRLAELLATYYRQLHHIEALQRRISNITAAGEAVRRYLVVCDDGNPVYDSVLEQWETATNTKPENAE